MNVSARVEYACVAVVELGLRYSQQQPVPLREITQSHAISAQFLAQILQVLKVAGLVNSSRGPAGGYQLAQPPHAICLWDVVRAVEGDILADSQSVPTTRIGSVLADVWRQVATAQRELLSGTTIEQLCLATAASSKPMYYI